MNHKNGNLAKQIIELQHDDGTWGNCFHSLARPNKRYSMTTEQALRRLWVLGFTIDDTPIRKTVDYMTSCLRGERKMDDCWEKTHNWTLFTQLMLSAWVKIFEPQNDLALVFAKRWARVIEKAFESGFYNDDNYKSAYLLEFSSPLNGGREIDFVHFYNVILLQGVLTRETENQLLEYIISKPNGIYYIYNKNISKLPGNFTSCEASWYLNALQIISGYELAKEKLGFAVDWINTNKEENGQWDFGAKANDGVYLPLSDSWRKVENRKADCTESVTSFLQRLEG